MCGLQRGLLFLGCGNVHAQAHAAAIGRRVVMRAHPAPVAKLLLVHPLRHAVLGQPFGEPRLFAPHRVGMLAMLQPIAQDVFEAGPGSMAGALSG